MGVYGVLVGFRVFRAFRCSGCLGLMVSVFCVRGDGDVVGVVAPLRGVAQFVLHGDQVVELSVLLGVHQEGGVEEDGEGQVEVEREGSRGQGETLMDGMRMG